LGTGSTPGGPSPSLVRSGLNIGAGGSSSSDSVTVSESVVSVSY
jgi:hypothetical protein